jgi:hypothetical protein
VRELNYNTEIEPQLYLLPHLCAYRRAYPRGSLAASVIGYVGVDGGGLAGVEHSFDAQVRGRAGRVTVLRDARRGMYLVGGEGLNRPVDGNDVVLTIDSVVQFITERALAKAVEKYHAIGGSAQPLLGDRLRFVGDAGIGLRAEHRIGDTRFVTRFDLPLWVNRPALAQDAARGDDPFAFRWVFSFQPTL